MTQFVGRLMDISHSQWLYRNFTLHHCTKWYLWQQTTDLIQWEVDGLSKVSNLDVPPESRYLLELPARPLEDSTATHNAYWALVMHAAQQSALWDKRRRGPPGRHAQHFQWQRPSPILLDRVKESLNRHLEPDEVQDLWRQRREDTLPRPAQQRRVDHTHQQVKVLHLPREDILLFEHPNRQTPGTSYPTTRKLIQPSCRN